MNKYVVAYCNLHAGELLQEVVEANSALEAAKSYLNWEDLEHVRSMDELEALAFDTDAFIHVLELNNRAGAGRPGPGLQTQLAQFDSESRVH